MLKVSGGVNGFSCITCHFGKPSYSYFPKRSMDSFAIMETFPQTEYHDSFFSIYLFIWLYQVLVAAHGIFVAACGIFFLNHGIETLQFSSVAQSCPTLCDPMNHSMPGLPVHHRLPEFTQTHVHQVGDTIQPSHPLSSPSPPAPNPSQHQSLFQ